MKNVLGNDMYSFPKYIYISSGAFREPCGAAVPYFQINRISMFGWSIIETS